MTAEGVMVFAIWAIQGAIGSPTSGVHPPWPGTAQTQLGRLQDNGDGTVTDTQTGLMWAARDNGSGIDWKNARDFCEHYRGGGHADWRMPTIAELRTLYDEVHSQPVDCAPECYEWCVHITPLIHLSCLWVWSSEPQEEEAAKLFVFTDGEVGWNPKFYRTGRALPVRAGKQTAY